ncbi:MAG TPA: hypothetical protein GX695_00345 [Acholeplasmataceae bacterium]|nr:hypothetical protein [Acholeplasmataceae bacterium]
MKNKLKDSSLLEIALEIMLNEEEPQTLNYIAEEVFKRKNIKEKQEDFLVQFEMDFMLSGLFLPCDEGKWHIKQKLSAKYLDKDGSKIYSTNDAFEDEIAENELKDENSYVGQFLAIDDDEEETERDEIAEELEELGETKKVSEDDDEEDEETEIDDDDIFDDDDFLD